ncbi:hypothetical protein IV203_005176 [Nitzschia inconspicua]|uniref:Transmembrane protein n=1 Tax=Nitzschia inconspicua TaxID=303405 RepID=A0A9K3PG38_9STRA|nr:hypothetical protein IV203_005176 [Nitzschia inconspicua]
MSTSAASASYRRVPQNEQQAAASSGGGSSESSASSNSNVSQRSRGGRLQDKCTAAIWIVGAYMISQWTNFYTVLRNSDEVNRTLLNISFVGFVIVITLLLYLMLYLPKVKGLTDPTAWGVYCPNTVPVMGVTTVVSILILIRALWPLWGFVAPFYAGSQVMGWLMATHFIPTLGLC